ncbi:type I glyceraldehyde-3-phosphate dehydrogenase [Brumimicrobium oceani]|uniref:Type I glyceraldehyde-3-phosphate dehydrogenase n=1 Tax=Brumimicrobium oceani TaxID=2100725 RepID=A0A2U2XD77_9FLAO|nr:type I glyceraldehyde-3-phosphate dehydrogenase [Brumimicrobium oceani]PWH85759.1 type I glyceraldehyde-3-phosphate dehydrogenase [Brumimicrobium oceani]
MKKIGVNGFGRIGRYFTRMSLKQSEVSVAVVNDLADIKTLAHLLKYDSVHRQIQEAFEVVNNTIVFENGSKIIFTQFSNPAEIPWAKYGVDIVLESTGLFRTEEAASAHFKGGAKKVVISAPGQGDNIKSVVLGVNDDILTPDDVLISNASCTTNSAAPMVKLFKDMCTITSAYITTVHSYTSDQRLHDAPHKDLRRARAAAESIVPTTTGAAKALTKIFPELEGHIGGCGIRVPVPDGSLTDLTLTVEGKVPTVEEINAEFKRASENELKGILSYTDEPLVSSDIIGNPNSCIFDSQLTSVVGNLVKLVGWYDNEAGYSNRLIDLMKTL